jgi:hypothetical protein
MNLSLKYYEQLEVIPVYQSSIIFTNILFGAVVFQEIKNYKWYNMATLILGFIICISGILVIFKKTSKPHGTPIIDEEEPNELDLIDSDDSDEQ